MILKPGEYVDISGMTMEEAKKIFPQLKYKTWGIGYYTILFNEYRVGFYNGLDAYTGDCDRREVWIQKELGGFKKVCLEDIGEL